jgi:hypothetical protein
MTQTKASNAGLATKKVRRPPLRIMVVQRLSEGVGPGPIHVVKKVLKEVSVGSLAKQVPVPVYLDHTLPAGTGALTASDKRALADQGLSAQEIAYVESKLPEKKLKSDAHKAAFEAGKAQRLREKLKKRLVAQFHADPDLAAGVMSALSGAPTSGDAPAASLPAASPQVVTLSDKVSRLLALVNEVGRDIEAYKERAKVGKTYDKAKLQVMLSPEAERDWKLSWFAFSRMIAQATGTDFARKQGWASDEELSKLAAAHGYKSTGAAP